MADIPTGTGTTVSLEDGQFLYGEIETIGDEDWIAIHAEAGQTWRFFWSALSATDAIGADVRVYDSTGTQVLVNVDNPGDWYDIWIQLQVAVTGVYYIAIGGTNGAPTTGTYSLAANLIEGSPLDALDWGTYLTTNEVDIYFAPAGGSYTTFDGVLTALAWDSYVVAREMAAFAEYAKVADITFRQSTTAADAELTLVYYDTDSDLQNIFGFFSPAGFFDEGLGGVNADNPVWLPAPGGSLEAGGKDFGKMVHEAGHALGLAHPHDIGGASNIMAGVSSWDDTGDHDLNQSIFTVMSYVEGWVTGPLGVPKLPDGSLDRSYGYAATPMAFDIALIQQKYGANLSWNTGDDTYVLPDESGLGTGYACIWDAGGHDAISAGDAALAAIIDLRAATLLYAPGGGGWLSWHAGIHGGVTIANGVVIEDAIGSTLGDTLIGNAAANRLEGRAGDDVMTGGDAADRFAFSFEATDGATEWFRPNDAGTGGLTPSANASVAAWRVYTQQLAEWRAGLEALYGADADSRTLTVTVPSGRGTTSFTYDNSYTRVASFSGEDGDDAITDWGLGGADRLAFEGLTAGQFANLLSSGRITLRTDTDVGGTAALDTVLAWAEGSVALWDVTLAPASLLADAILLA